MSTALIVVGVLLLLLVIGGGVAAWFVFGNTPAPTSSTACVEGEESYGGKCYMPCPAGSAINPADYSQCVSSQCEDGSKPGPTGTCYLKPTQSAADGTCGSGFTKSDDYCYPGIKDHKPDPNMPGLYSVAFPRPTA